MSTLQPGIVTDAARVHLTLERVPGDQVIDGAPWTGWTQLDDGIGVWEMTPGAMSDVETDEVFLVLTGDATVEFEQPDLPPIELRPGAVVRLTAGMRTLWTVRETLRKVFWDG